MKIIIIFTFLILAICAFTDCKSRCIPNVFSFSLLILGLVSLFFRKSPLPYLLTTIILLCITLPLYFKGFSIGGGDIKLMACCALIFGPIPTLKIVLFGCLSAFIHVAMCLIFMKKKLSSVPFALFILIGSILAVPTNIWG